MPKKFLAALALTGLVAGGPAHAALGDTDSRVLSQDAHPFNAARLSQQVSALSVPGNQLGGGSFSTREGASAAQIRDGANGSFSAASAEAANSESMLIAGALIVIALVLRRIS